MKLIDRIKSEYPLPMEASIWGDDKLTNLSEFLQICLDDLSSDLEIYESTFVQGLQTKLPDSTRAVASVKLDVQFQGNRYVKFTFDSYSKILNCRYYPAVVTYKRSVTLDDFESSKPIIGARLRYFVIHTLGKMLDKEISYYGSIPLNQESGAIDLNYLQSVRQSFKTEEDLMKEDIMLYSNV